MSKSHKEREEDTHLEDAASDAKDSASDVSSSAMDAVSQAAESVRQVASDTADAVREHVGDLMDKGHAKATETAEKVATHVQEHTWTSLLLAALFGLIIGLLLPRKSDD